MLNIYDIAHLGLLGVIVILMLTGYMNFTTLYLIVVAMILIMLFRIMDLESRPVVDKASKLKDAEKFDAIDSKIQKLRERVDERISDIENRMTDDAVLEERLGKLYDRLTGIEDQLRANTNNIGDLVGEMERRLRRIEMELGLVDDIIGSGE